jgi:hypothetical protein
LYCQNGALRTLQWKSATITADIKGQRASGTSVSTWEVLMPDVSGSLGTLTMTEQFTATRQ